jgi:hypothetical protein
MPVFNIPVINQNQTFQVTLNNVTYTLRLLWNQFANCWMLDINDVNNNPILNSIPLLAGRDLLKQFGYTNINGYMITYNTSNYLLPPGYADLGNTSFLQFIPYV